MNKISRIIITLFCVVLLVLIRAYASNLFYDPLILFFKKSAAPVELPEFDFLGLLLNTSLRFWMNTVISLTILWFVFRSKEVVKMSLVLYGIAFVLLIMVFAFLLQINNEGPFMALFYIRRFLIQPLFILILIPGFYFFRNTN